MITASTRNADLMQSWLETDPDHARVSVTFPIGKWTGAGETAVVYFELQPGDRLGTHTDSAEEVLYIVSGEAEAHVGDERVHVRAGDLAVVPEMVPHGLRTIGDEPVKVVGFFCKSEITSTFEAPMQPAGTAVLEMGAIAA